MPGLPVLMPMLAFMAGVCGYFFAPAISAGKGLIVPLLSLIMLLMGLTLTPKDFVREVRNPLPLFVGMGLQFLLMPLLAWLISRSLNLPPAIMAGMVLVGTAPGGTASNVLAYLAKGNVALSISMTTASTLMAVIMMPLLTGFYLDAVVDVDRAGMLMSIVQVVILPVLAGLTANSLWPDKVKHLHPTLPTLSMIAIVVTITIVVALNAGSLSSLGIPVLAAVLLHNSLGLVGGYSLSRMAGMSKRQSRTIAIEVGTQNSGLSVALAVKHFTALAALPGAIFSVSQNILGAAAAGYWRKKCEQENS